ncbi:MAG: hypothetical protein KTR28_06465 [Micavibrio sp.]|nr:hypothetical protein [Micavibrio sp.]
MSKNKSIKKQPTKPISNIFLDTEYLSSRKPSYLNQTIPISIGLVNEDASDLYRAGFKEAWHKEIFDKITRDQWIYDNVLTKLPPPQDPVWKPFDEIRKGVIDFLKRNAAEKINIWVKGDNGIDNTIFISFFGDQNKMWRKLQVGSTKSVRIRNSLSLRKTFKKHASSWEIQKICPSDERRVHEALYDAWLEQKVFKVYKTRVPQDEFTKFESRL